MLFVDPVAVSSAESLPVFVEKMTCGVLLPYMAIMATLAKTKGFGYGRIFAATAFTLLGICASIVLFKAVYRLLVILPEVKRTTGEDVFADVHNFLRNNPERVQQLFGKKCSPKFEKA